MRCLCKKTIGYHVGGFLLDGNQTCLALPLKKEAAHPPLVWLSGRRFFCTVKIGPELNMSDSDSALCPEDKPSHSQARQGSLEWRRKRAGCMINAAECIQSLGVVRLESASPNTYEKKHILTIGVSMPALRGKYLLCMLTSHSLSHMFEGCIHSVAH